MIAIILIKNNKLFFNVLNAVNIKCKNEQYKYEN